MESNGEDEAKAEIVFAFPYEFYNRTHVENGYNAKHDSIPIDVVLDEDKNIFRLFCRSDDIELHGSRFPLYIKNYVNTELDRSGKDLINGDPPQVKQLWNTSNSRSTFYDLARREAPTMETGIQRLIDTDQFTQTIPYSIRVYKATDINRTIFRTVATKTKCDLNWRGLGLQVLSNNRDVLEETVAILAPAVALLEGVTANIYWIDAVAGLKLRLLKLARAADYSIYRFRDFRSTHFDLHLVKWDSTGLQHVSLRPKKLESIAYPEGAKNHWQRNVKIRFGSDENAPSRWANSEELSSANLSTLTIKERTHTIESWMTSVSEAKGLKAQSDVTDVKDVPSSSDRNQGKLWANGEQIEKKENEIQPNQTDIDERRRALDAFDMDKPRTRHTPRLKAGSRASFVRDFSKPGNPKEERLDFISILVQQVARLITSLKLHRNESSSCIIEIGQLFVSSIGIPPEYVPDTNRASQEFLPMYWDQLFGEEAVKSRSCGAYFSTKLTSSDDDALFMNNTLLQSAARTKSLTTVFELKPWSDRAFYKICCQNTSTGTTAVLEVENNQATSIKVQPRLVGYVNIHFPQYIWDARINACGTPKLSPDDEEEFKHLLNTIWIGTTDQASKKGEKLYARKQEHVRILSCQRIRERIHRTTEDLPDEKAIYLHLNKVEELQIANISSTPGGFCAFSLVQHLTSDQPGSSTTRDRDQRIWYEASIHSESIKRILPGSSNPGPYSRQLNDTESFVAPQDNEPLKRFLRSELAPLFNATHGLVTQWNSVGARDRAKAPVDMKGDLRMAGGTSVLEGSSASALASRSKGKMVL